LHHSSKWRTWVLERRVEPTEKPSQQVRCRLFWRLHR